MKTTEYIDRSLKSSRTYSKKKKICKYYKGDHVFDQIIPVKWHTLSKVNTHFSVTCLCGKIDTMCSVGDHCHLQKPPGKLRWTRGQCYGFLFGECPLSQKTK